MPPSSCLSASAFQQEELGLFDLPVIWMREVFIQAVCLIWAVLFACMCGLSDEIAPAY